MHFGNLIGALIYGSIAMAAVVALYFLKLRRRSEIVSSTLLWQRCLEDLKVNSPFQKLRASLLLLLQVLMLLLATWALAKPMMWLQQRAGKDFIFIIDNSASMNATDLPGDSRLEDARSRLLTAINNMSGGDKARIITCGGGARVLGAFTDSKEALRSDLASVEPTDCRTNLHEALSIGLALAQARIAQAGGDGSLRKTEVHIFADGGFDKVSDLSRGKADLIYHPIGTKFAHNVGIISIDAQRIPGTKQSAVFTSLRNFSAAPAEGMLGLYNGSKLLDGEAITFKPGEELSRIFMNLPIEEGVLTLKLEVDDDLEADNTAYISLRSSRDAKLLLVTAGNMFLQRALDQRDTELDVVSFDDYKPTSSYDVIIFDRWMPDQLPDGNYLVFKQPPPPPYGPQGEAKLVKRPALVVDIEAAHPIARHANLWELLPAQTMQFPPPSQAQVIVQADEGPLVWAVEAPEGRMVYVSFDIFLTYNNWPLRVSFPLFIANSIEWLAQGSGRRAKPLMRTGDIITLATEEAVKKVAFTSPGGGTENVDVTRRRASFGATDKIGIYTVEPAGGEVGKHVVAVNLLDARESDITIQKDLVLSGVPVQIGVRPGKVNREVWWWFALGAFAFLLIEWWTYHRRVFA